MSQHLGRFPFRSPATQVSSLQRMVRSLKTTDALERAHQWKSGDQVCAVVHPEQFGAFANRILFEVWERKAGWKVQNTITELRSPIAEFRSALFERVPKTDHGYRSAAPYTSGNPAPIFLKVQLGTQDVSQQADIDDFELDLASLLCVLSTHTRQLEEQNADLYLCCRGELYHTVRVPDKSLVPVIEYVGHKLSIGVRSIEECREHLSFKGVLI